MDCPFNIMHAYCNYHVVAVPMVDPDGSGTVHNNGSRLAVLGECERLPKNRKSPSYKISNATFLKVAALQERLQYVDGRDGSCAFLVLWHIPLTACRQIEEPECKKYFIWTIY